METYKIGENYRKKNRKFFRLSYKISHIFAAMYPRPMNIVPNISLCPGLSSGVSHMQII